MSLSLGRIAQHEFRLAWRDWSWFLRPGRRRWRLAFWLIVFFAFLQAVALSIVSAIPPELLSPSKQSFLLVTASAFLSWMMMLSQAMEQVTRAFYSRADLDLLLSSPVSAGRVFAIRIGAIALSATTTALLAAFPFINALMLFHGPRWIAVYGVVLAMGAAGTAVAAAITVALFRTLGPKRTRLFTQILSAVIGAGFVIGLQLATIASIGNLSRFSLLSSPRVLAMAPAEDSPVWLPARAMMGDVAALLLVVAASVILLLAVILLIAPRFGYHAVIAAGASSFSPRGPAPRAFRKATPRQALIAKEWKLIRRDPWLVSQTLLQLLYLLPPAFLLWRNFGQASGMLVIIAPLLVMVAGQLAGGIAWLAISGEDAPELVATAPLAPGVALAAKRRAVLGGVAMLMLPMVAALAFASPFAATVTLLLALVSAAASTQIQLWFRAQARRSQFRRRQTSSRIATFAEAFSSILWATSAAFLAVKSLFAIVPVAAALIVLAIARAIRPKESAS